MLQRGAREWGAPFVGGAGVAFAAGRVTRSEAAVAWAGDVRAIVIQKDGRSRGTIDHSVRNSERARGVSLPSPAERYDGILTRLLGGDVAAELQVEAIGGAFGLVPAFDTFAHEVLPRARERSG